jgi:hypothetical protein
MEQEKSFAVLMTVERADRMRVFDISLVMAANLPARMDIRNGSIFRVFPSMSRPLSFPTLR